MHLRRTDIRQNVTGTGVCHMTYFLSGNESGSRMSATPSIFSLNVLRCAGGQRRRASAKSAGRRAEFLLNGQTVLYRGIQDCPSLPDPLTVIAENLLQCPRIEGNHRGRMQIGEPDHHSLCGSVAVQTVPGVAEGTEMKGRAFRLQQVTFIFAECIRCDDLRLFHMTQGQSSGRQAGLCRGPLRILQGSGVFLFSSAFSGTGRFFRRITRVRFFPAGRSYPGRCQPSAVMAMNLPE